MLDDVVCAMLARTVRGGDLPPSPAAGRQWLA
jgi:hypothetical protein